MRPFHLAGSLALLLALSACTGGQSTSTPTAPPSPVVSTTTKTSAKIVTDIGLAAAVTRTPTTPTPTPTEVLPTSTPLPLARLELLSQSTYKDATGGLWVVGEAKNTGTHTATDIEVTLSLLGADGKPVVVSYATTHLSEVPAGGKMPFRGLFATPPQGAGQVKIDLRTVPVYPDTSSDLAIGLSVLEPKLSPPVGSGGAVVSGKLKNGGKEAAFMVRIVAISRGPDGKVTDIADGYVPQPEIATGESVGFSLQFPRAREAGSFEVFAQGLIKAK